MTNLVKYLFDRSASRAAEMERIFVDSRLGDPDAFARDLYQRNPDLYAKWAMAVYNGARDFFAEQSSGRKGVSEQQIQEALDFQARYKDTVKDESTAIDPSDPALAEKLQEMEQYFPDEARLIRQLSEANKTLASQNQQLSTTAAKAEPAADLSKSQTDTQAQQEAVAQEIDGLWNLGRDTAVDYVRAKATDTKTGIGIHVTPEERKSAPLVAMLKDIKKNVFLFGLEVDDKSLITSFQEGVNVWGKDRKEYVDTILGIHHYAQAREKQNVLELTRELFPHIDIYYNDRLKHPIFNQLDNLITLVATKTNAPPKFDPIKTGGLPAAAKAPGHATEARVNANSDQFLISDAVQRAAKLG